MTTDFPNFPNARRADAKRLIARNIAVNEGRVWDRLDEKNKTNLLVLAEVILAIVERKMTDFRW